jgi:hypothetical protein
MVKQRRRERRNPAARQQQPVATVQKQPEAGEAERVEVPKAGLLRFFDRSPLPLVMEGQQ